MSHRMLIIHITTIGQASMYLAHCIIAQLGVDAQVVDIDLSATLLNAQVGLRFFAINEIGKKQEDVSKPITIDIKIENDEDLIKFNKALEGAKKELDFINKAGEGASIPIRVNGREYYTTDSARIAKRKKELEDSIKYGEENIIKYKDEILRKAEDTNTEALVLDNKYLELRNKLYLNSIKDRSEREKEAFRINEINPKKKKKVIVLFATNLKFSPTKFA